MSRKAKSELAFIIKIFILFLILFANKLNKSTEVLNATIQALTPKEPVTIVTASIQE